MGPRTLRSRLFGWFVGAILLAIGTGSVVAVHTRPEPYTPVEAVVRHMAVDLAERWEDPARTTAYVDEIRDVTGLDARLLREPERLPPRVKRMAERRGMTWDGAAGLTLPIVRGGDVVGALELPRIAHPIRDAWWRFALALALALALLSAMGGAVADQLARPLERLARAADRLGAGDLTARADGAGGEGRWVAREVRAVAVSFDRMAARVEALVRSERELLGAISHELRSPLGRARVALEIVRDRVQPVAALASPAGPKESSGGPALVSKALDDVERQLQALDSILGDLLDGMRAGLSDVRKRPFSMAAWLRERIGDEPPLPPIQLDVSPEAESIVVSADSALLARALHNLLQNARTHGHPREEPLHVQLSRVGGPPTEPGRVPRTSADRDAKEGPRVRLVVRDRGPGFPEGFAARAFEPFVRGDPARARRPDAAGAGLGLTIVRRIVEAHGGRVFARTGWEGEWESGPHSLAPQRKPEGESRGSPGAARKPEGESRGSPGAEVGLELPLERRDR